MHSDKRRGNRAQGLQLISNSSEKKNAYTYNTWNDKANLLLKKKKVNNW